MFAAVSFAPRTERRQCLALLTQLSAPRFPHSCARSMCLKGRWQHRLGTTLPLCTSLPSSLKPGVSVLVKCQLLGSGEPICTQPMTPKRRLGHAPRSEKDPGVVIPPWPCLCMQRGEPAMIQEAGEVLVLTHHLPTVQTSTTALTSLGFKFPVCKTGWCG